MNEKGTNHAGSAIGRSLADFVLDRSRAGVMFEGGSSLWSVLDSSLVEKRMSWEGWEILWVGRCSFRRRRGRRGWRGR